MPIATTVVVVIICKILLLQVQSWHWWIVNQLPKINLIEIFNVIWRLHAPAWLNLEVRNVDN